MVKVPDVPPLLAPTLNPKVELCVGVLLLGLALAIPAIGPQEAEKFNGTLLLLNSLSKTLLIFSKYGPLPAKFDLNRPSAVCAGLIGFKLPEVIDWEKRGGFVPATDHGS